MSKIISIGTAVPEHCHQQMDILDFMQSVYAENDRDKRKMHFLYQYSGIGKRYSVLSTEQEFYPKTHEAELFPSLEERLKIYSKIAPMLSVKAIKNCLGDDYDLKKITHLITVSCTGMSAPGLDLEVMELLNLEKNVSRTSVNFMGCYAAVHALKMANAICKADVNAQVIIVCTELCTLHFQKEATMDNITASLLFADGSAAALITSNENENTGLHIDHFYSEIIPKGKKDMAWQLSSNGFLMTLSNYIPDLIEEDFRQIIERALQKENLSIEDVSHWCIHPGGKRILDEIHRSLDFTDGQLKASYNVLNDYGNLSSPTILFVLKEILQEKKSIPKLVGAAFGPGLTIETFTAHL